MKLEAPDGHTYITASHVRLEDGYADLTAALLRTWADTGALPVVTRAELATALGRTVPPGVDGAAPARAPGPSGDENVYRWDHIVRTETAGRLHRRKRGGRPRRQPPTSAV